MAKKNKSLKSQMIKLLGDEVGKLNGHIKDLRKRLKEEEAKNK